VEREPEPLAAWRGLVLWLLLIATAALAIHGLTPPRPLDESAPADQFSAARAKAHLQQIAREPHPVGTAANQRVRDYLVEQLTALGAEVRVEKTIGITHYDRQILAGTAENVVATVKGTSSSRAVMLASHYDTVPESPGAADAGSGVAAILEVLRALKVGAPLQNDLLIVITDGEEEGLIGAAGFVRDHPDVAQRVGIVLNFEARGSSGPALMFETSDGNGWITREFARAAPYPMASSLAYAVYKRLPNNTDMTVFKKAGLAGFNFAFSATFENYHTRRDSVDNLDPRSLQHVGFNALALTRHFGNLQLGDERPPNRVFFNWYGSSLVHYPAWVVWAILALVGGLLTAVLIMLGRRGLVRPLHVLGGLAAFLLVVLASLGAAYAVWSVVSATTAGRLLFGDTTSNILIVLACAAAALVFALVVQSWLAAKLGRYNFAIGQLLFFAITTAAITVMLPEASYVFQWPLVFALAGLGGALVARRSTGAAFCAFIGSVPAILIFAPLMYLLFVIIGMETIAVCVVATLLALLLAVTSPLIVHISGSMRVVVPLLLLCSVAFAVTGRHLSRFSPEHPRRNSIFYSVNADEGRAAWLSNDDAPDDWTAQFLTSAPTRGTAPELTVGGARSVLSHAAELLPLEPPSATVISDSSADGKRALKLHITSPRDADMLLMRLAVDVNVVSVSINGREYAIPHNPAASGPWLLRYNAIPPEGFELELRVESNAPIDCWLGDRSLGLPQGPTTVHHARPADMMAKYGSDVTLVTRRYRF
jgi:hypothetical protein